MQRIKPKKGEVFCFSSKHSNIWYDRYYKFSNLLKAPSNLSIIFSMDCVAVYKVTYRICAFVNKVAVKKTRIKKKKQT